MRRWISFFLLLVLLTISLPVTFAAALPHVVDEANLLTSHELQSLSQQAETIGDRYQVDVVILTVVSLEGKDPESYADDYYDQRGYGLGSDRSGILLLISTESRDWAISTCGQAITWVTDQDLERLEKTLLLLGGLAGGAVLLILRRQMRTARPQRYAGDYAVPGSFQLTLQRDIYLYSRTTRVKRQTTQNGDSFHGGGSSTHRSSSGSSHGGSHGKF